jgi:hypothetical protein
MSRRILKRDSGRRFTLALVLGLAVAAGLPSWALEPTDPGLLTEAPDPTQDLPKADRLESPAPDPSHSAFLESLENRPTFKSHQGNQCVDNCYHQWEACWNNCSGSPTPIACKGACNTQHRYCEATCYCIQGYPVGCG